MTTQNQTVPAGYMQDAKGRLVPISSVKPIDLLREDLVLQLVEQAKLLNQALREFKDTAFGDIAAFVQTSAEQYGATLGGKKGNVTLHSYDGRYKVVRQAQDNIRFDETRLAASNDSKRATAAEAPSRRAASTWACATSPRRRASTPKSGASPLSPSAAPEPWRTVACHWIAASVGSSPSSSDITSRVFGLMRSARMGGGAPRVDGEGGGGGFL